MPASRAARTRRGPVAGEGAQRPRPVRQVPWARIIVAIVIAAVGIGAVTMAVQQGRRRVAEAEADRQHMLTTARDFEAWGNTEYDEIQAGYGAGSEVRVRAAVEKLTKAQGLLFIDVVGKDGGLFVGAPSGREMVRYGPPGDLPDKRPQAARVQRANGKLFYNRMLMDSHGLWLGNLRMTAAADEFRRP